MGVLDKLDAKVALNERVACGRAEGEERRLCALEADQHKFQEERTLFLAMAGKLEQVVAHLPVVRSATAMVPATMVGARQVASFQSLPLQSGLSVVTTTRGRSVSPPPMRSPRTLVTTLSASCSP